VSLALRQRSARSTDAYVLEAARLTALASAMRAAGADRRDDYVATTHCAPPVSQPGGVLAPGPWRGRQHGYAPRLAYTADSGFAAGGYVRRGPPQGGPAPHALPREGPPRIGAGTRAFYVGVQDWPLLSDAEIAVHLELPAGPLPEEFRLALDRIGDGSLTLAAVGSVAAAMPGLFLLDPPPRWGWRRRTLEPFISGDGDEDLRPERAQRSPPGDLPYPGPLSRGTTPAREGGGPRRRYVPLQPISW
jgi:hypothetical protein